jgi:hypothetical protein
MLVKKMWIVILYHFRINDSLYMLLIKIQFIGKEFEHQVPFKNLPLFKFLFPNYINIPAIKITAQHPTVAEEMQPRWGCWMGTCVIVQRYGAWSRVAVQTF